jgi:hypothetical protein
MGHRPPDRASEWNLKLDLAGGPCPSLTPRRASLIPVLVLISLSATGLGMILAFVPGAEVVIAPGDYDSYGFDTGCYERAQPHRRRKESLLRSRPIIAFLLGQALFLRHDIELVISIGIRALNLPRFTRNEKAG